MNAVRSIRQIRFRNAAAALIVLLLLAATRWPLAPDRLFFFDSANFALALDDFNPALHQPQPPGYPLFVGLTRLIHVFVPDAQDVFVIAGLLGAWAALLLIWALGTQMFGRAAGLLATALLFANPPFWLGGITNEIRIFLAVGSLGTGLLAWRALQENASATWFYGAFAWLGIAAGFRPVESMLLVPLLLWVWVRTGCSFRRLVLAILCFCATVAPSVAVTVFASGGIHKTTHLLWDYANDQFHGSSRLFGATEPAAFHMFAEALVWNGLGAVAWIWALPARAVRQAYSGWSVRVRFLLVWFLPAFLFSALVHIGDPDQALTTIPVLCVLGGAVLASLVEHHGRRRVWTMAACAVAMCSALFFMPPPGKLARASSYHAVASGGRITDAAISAIEDIRKRGQAVIIHYGFPVSYRQISYYFPDDYVVVLPGMPGSASSSGEAWVLFRRKLVSRYKNGSEVVLPAAKELVFLLPPGTQPLKVAPALGPATRRGRVFYTTSLPQKDFQFGEYHLAIRGTPYAHR